jgi:hypothetical protein
MPIDNPMAQLESAARRAGLHELFGPLSFVADSIAAAELCSEGDECEVRFGNADGPIGVLYIDLYDSGNPEDDGLTVGLRGWRLGEGTASV